MVKKKNNSFSGFQWALIELLQTISSEFIFGKIVPRWQQSVKESHLFARNILVGFLNVYEMLDPQTAWEKKVKDRIENIFLSSFPARKKALAEIRNEVINGKIDSTIHQEKYKELLDTLLKYECHLLFNSYFCTLEEIYGHQRLLFSKIGYDPSDDKAVENFNNNLAYFDYQKLPFRVYNSKEFAITYANQLLPISAGVTPHFLQRAIRSAMEKNPRRLFNVNFFLESLSLLHKREDFIQGHNSALIYVLQKEKHFIENKNDPQFFGCLILTCIIPGVLKDTEEDLLSIIEKTDDSGGAKQIALPYPNRLGNITDQYEPLSFTIDKFKVYHPKQASYDSPIITKNAIADLNAIADENFNTLLSSRRGNNQVFVQLEYQYPLEAALQKSQHHIINVDAMYHFARMLFPTETTVDYNLISGAKSAEKNILHKIDFNALKKYNEFLNSVFSIDPNQKFTVDKQQLSSENIFSQFLYCLFPEKEGTEADLLRHIHTETVSSGDNNNAPYRMVFFVEDEESPKFKKRISELKKAIADSLKESINLPDGENPVFLALEKHWSEAHRMSEKHQFPSNTNEKTTALFELIKKIIAECGVRGMFILRERNYYIPDLNAFDVADNDFVECMQTYPSFWLFERLSSYLGAGKHLYNFGAFEDEGQMSIGKCMSFVYKYEQEKNNNITVTYNPTSGGQNQYINRVLLFLGIHVTEFKFEQSRVYLNPRFQIDDGEYYDDIRTFYKAYLKERMKDVIQKKTNIVTSIFKDHEIRSIDWDEAEGNKINIKFLLVKNGKEKLYVVPWEATVSSEIEMAIIDINKISSCFATKQGNSTRFNTVSTLSIAEKETLEIKEVLSYSGHTTNYENLENSLKGESFRYFTTYIKNLQSERNEINSKLLLELNEVFLHRINRINQYLVNYLAKIHDKIYEYYFKLGFFKIKEAQRQLYAISPRSKPEQFNAATFEFKGRIDFESILLFFYLRNIDPEEIYPYLFTSPDDFKSSFYDPLLKLLEVSQTDSRQFGIGIFHSINQCSNFFLDIYNKITAIEVGSVYDVRPHQLEYPKNKKFAIPNKRTKYFWTYFACILDEIMDNSFANSKKLAFSFEGKKMYIKSLLNQPPGKNFIEEYGSESFIPVTKPIIDERNDRTSFGIYGLKLACEALGWHFSIKYNSAEETIYQQIDFKETSPFK